MKVYKKIALFVSFSFFLTYQPQACASIKTEFSAAVKSIKELIKKVKASTKERRRFTLANLISNIPILNKIKLPAVTKKFLGGMVLEVPKITMEKDTYILQWAEPLVFGSRKKFLIRLYVGPGKGGKGFGFSLSVGLPGRWPLSEMLPGAKALTKPVQFINLENVGFVLSSGLHDPIWGKTGFGLNLFCTVRFGGPVEKLLSVFGKDLAALKGYGIIKPLIAGSDLKLIYPGRFTILRIPADTSKPSQFEIRTGEGIIRLGLTYASVPTLKFTGGLDFKFPGQKDFVALKGFGDLMLLAVPPAVEIGGKMEGLIKNMFGIPAFNMGNLGISATVSPSPPFLVGLAGQGEIQLGPIKGKGFFQADIPKSSLAVLAELKKITHRDVVDYIAAVIEESAKMRKQRVNIGALKNAFYAATPPFKIGHFRVYVVPKATEIFDKKYSSGVHLKGGLEIFGLGGGFEFFFSWNKASIVSWEKLGLKGMVYLKEIRLPKVNPVFILTGGGPNMKRGDSDDGPIIHAELSPSRQVFYIDNFLSIPPLGISANTHVLVHPVKGFEFDIGFKLAGVFDTALRVRGNPKSLANFYVKGYFKQPALGSLGRLLTTEANKEFKKAQKNLNKAKADVKKWQNQAKKDIEKWISDRIKDTQFHIDRLQGWIDSTNIACGQGNIGACFKKILIPAWEIEKGFHILHKELTVKRLLKEMAKFGVNFVSESAKFGIETSKAAVTFGQVSSNMIGQIAQGAFNITRVDLEGTLKGLIYQGTLPKVRVRGIILGKKFDQVYEINFKKPGQFPSQIIRGFMQIFGPQQPKRRRRRR